MSLGVGNTWLSPLDVAVFEFSAVSIYYFFKNRKSEYNKANGTKSMV